MTIASETSRVNLVGDGENDTFTFTFEIYVKTDLLVYVDNVLQEVDVNYTIADESIENSDGGEIVFGEDYIPADEAVVSLILNLPFTQLIDYVEADKFPAETHERGLDRLVKIVQQLKERIARHLSLLKSSPYSNLTLPDPVASKLLAWKDDLSGIKNVEIESEGDLAVTEYIKTLLDDESVLAARATLVDNSYFPDPAQADQGATVGLATIKDFVDSIGTSKKATIVVSRGSVGNTTTYTLTTSETIPSNITLKMEPGAILDGAGTLTINGPFEAGLSQCFGSSITVTFGSGAIEYDLAEWWGIDGTADNVQINVALAAYSNTYLPHTYTIADDLTPSSNSHIWGNGRSSKIIQTTNYKNVFTLSSKSKVLIEKLYLYGDGTADAATNGCGVLISASNEVTVKDCYIENFGLAGVQIRSGDKNIITNNRFVDNKNGIAGEGTDILVYYDSDENIIDGNYCFSTNACGIRIVSDDTLTATGNQIINNEVKNHVRYGIILYCTGNDVISDTLVSGNHVEDILASTSYGMGIYALNVGTTRILNNHVEDCCKDRTNFTLTSGAISVANSNQVTLNDNFVIGNEEEGIEISTSTGCKCVGNEISGNGKSGIYVYSSDVLLSHNNVQDGSYGIRINAADHCVVEGNRAKNSSNSGIFIEDSDECLIANNKCYDDQGIKTQTYGIYEGGTSDYNIYQGNHVRGNKTLNMRIVGANSRGLENIGVDETVTANAQALHLYGVTYLDSSGGARTGTLADGLYQGQQKLISMQTAGNNFDITIAHHETEDNEVARFDLADEYLLLVWTGTEWATVNNSCTFP